MTIQHVVDQEQGDMARRGAPFTVARGMTVVNMIQHGRRHVWMTGGGVLTVAHGHDCVQLVGDQCPVIHGFVGRRENQPLYHVFGAKVFAKFGKRVLWCQHILHTARVKINMDFNILRFQIFWISWFMIISFLNLNNKYDP